MTQGMLEALSGAIGEADNEIGGLIETRLTAEVVPTTALVAVYTWNGTTIISSADTSEVVVGDWISLDADGQQFQIIDVIPNTSIEIDNPSGYTIPTGATPSSIATRVLPVESVLDWDAEGKVGIDGVVYYYSDRTDTELLGISHVRGGVFTAGVKKLHHIESPIINLNRKRSALDLVRRAMLVAYAEGEDLNALGRNLGVNRYPFLASDEIFRQIVEALAYNPKGTVFGLELALNALVGEGNYEIVEDLINYPCTVFIRLLGAAVTDSISEGKTYLTGPEYKKPLTDTTFTIAVPITTRGSMGSVTWKDENLLTSSRLNYPSAHVIQEFTGDTPHAAWVLIGTGVTEGVDITLTGTETEFTNTPPVDSAYYERKLRIAEESEAYFGMLVTVPTGAPVDAMVNTGMGIDDGSHQMFVAVEADTVSTLRIGLWNGSYLAGGGVQVARDAYHQVVLHKVENNRWDLYVDGSFIETYSYAASPAFPSGTYMGVGHFGLGSNKLRLKQLSVWVHTTTDFWAARGTGSVNVANPTRFVASASIFNSGDVGKTIELTNSAIVNAQNGNNNGRYLVDTYLSGTQVELAGPVEENATLQTAFPLRITVPTTGRQFQFPDDLGKEIVISGSTLGNDGTYVIDKLLQAGTLVDLESFDTPLPETTNVCEVVAAAFVTETGLPWQVNPVFDTESPLDWELSDAGTVIGTAVTLRQALPLTSTDCYRVLSVIYSNVLSAQLLANSLVNNVWDPLNLLFTYYPFYIADPLGFVRTYLDAITAAGVIPDFLVE